MLTKNPGLKDICHSITGGALVAQGKSSLKNLYDCTDRVIGYWIPHAAAKAIAATFCYDIRHALTPVFGHDFLQLCIRPGSEGYGDMTIDPAITQHCAEEAARFREEEPNTTPQVSPALLDTRTPSPSNQRAKAARTKVDKSLRSPYQSPSSYLSPYDSDVSSDDSYTLAPLTPIGFRNPWQSVNTYKSPPRSVPYPDRHLPSPRALIARRDAQYNKTPDIPLTPPPTIASRGSSIELSPTAIPRQQMSALRSTCTNEAEPIARSTVGGKLNDAILVMCSATGLDRVEVVRRLGISEDHQNEINHDMDAAITMESLKTGLAWGEVASRLELPGDGHKRSASW